MVAIDFEKLGHSPKILGRKALQTGLPLLDEGSQG